MKLKELKLHFTDSLLDFYLETEINSFFFLLCKSLLEKQRVNVVLDYEEQITEADNVKFRKAILRLKNYEPIQYIIGKTEFYSLPYKVNSSVLIPRPETEELISFVLQNSKNKISNSKYEGFRILDIGTGSGCIAISLAKNLPNAKVFALDVSSKALNVAKENAKLNNVEIEFLEVDILNWNLDFENLDFDIIVSNPPYVRALEKKKMSANVLKHEPHVALFVEDEDPLLFYRNIAKFANRFLNPNGHLYFEINEYLGKDMMKLLKVEGFVNLELKTDFFGKDRMIKGVRL